MIDQIELAEPLAAISCDLRARVEGELRGNILPFWSAHMVDAAKGGFYGALTNDLRLRDDAPRSAVLCTRMLWTYAAAYRRFGHPGYLATAQHALAYLWGHFWDARHGGVHWQLDAFGQPLSRRKHSYAQAFAIYALAEYHRATADAASLRLAQRLFGLLDRHAHDAIYGGYIEGCGADWGALADMRLSQKEPNCRKSMNTMLHLLEAYTGLLCAWPDALVRARLAELVTIFLDRIIDARAGRCHLFFDDAWRPLGGPVSYGHDIECGWLLVRAAEVLGDDGLLRRARRAALALTQAVYENGRAADGSVAYEGGAHASGDDRHWWVQAEALVGFYNAYQISGHEHFAQATEACWQYIEARFVDRRYGEWFKVLDWRGVPRADHPKAGPWECPYHHTRAALELLARLPD
ncbi:AGE family epimerase/isomerase [Kouleothrix sp.]|uniref:AGE family epimerase/isomerase n=1 Tax=Kouleothrix sp. TaxID=2779161 RepID=UPI00391A709D